MGFRKGVENISVGTATMALFIVLCAVVYGIWGLVYNILNYFGVFNILVGLIYTSLAVFGLLAVGTLLYEMGDNVNRILEKKYRRL